MKRTTELLVSVRSAAEAETALAGGAGLIDVKEPANGSLGRATDDAIAAVVRQVGRRRPVSAALGELREQSPPFPGPGLDYVKWGLAGWAAPGMDWRLGLTEAAEQLARSHPGAGSVAVAYADWEQATAPPPAEVCAFACDRRWQAFLLDTWKKNGRTLLDWLSVREITRLCRLARAAGMRVALAGSVGIEQVRRLRGAEPDWFAVRGAVCRDGRREREIDSGRVSLLVELLSGKGDQGQGRPVVPLARKMRTQA